jgi:hypothetical protein
VNGLTPEYTLWLAAEVARAGLHYASMHFYPDIGCCMTTWMDPMFMLTSMGNV